MRLASRVRPCRISATTTPVSTKGSASLIIRRNSSPARPGAELKKSIHTELSTRINRASSASLSSHPSRSPFHNGEGGPSGSPSAPAAPALCLRFLASSSAASACAPCAPSRHQSRCLFCPYSKYTPFPKNMVYIHPGSCPFKLVTCKHFNILPPRSNANKKVIDKRYTCVLFSRVFVYTEPRSATRKSRPVYP